MSDHRGFSLIELLVAALLTTMVAVGLFSAYLAAARSLTEASVQTALQRQGTLALEEIGRQVQSAGDSKDLTTEAFTPGTMCNGHADSVQVNTPSGTTVCYYATPEGALCEFRGVSCRNLLAGGLGTIALLMQSEPPDPRCPAGVATGTPCFSVTRNESYPRQIDVWFAIRDKDGAFDAYTAMSFRTTLTCSGRNC